MRVVKLKLAFSQSKNTEHFKTFKTTVNWKLTNGNKSGQFGNREASENKTWADGRLRLAVLSSIEPYQPKG